MLTDIDIESVKQKLRRGCTLRNRGNGWVLEAGGGYQPKRKEAGVRIEVPDAIVALLTAQGCIKTELRLVGSASWSL